MLKHEKLHNLFIFKRNCAKVCGNYGNYNKDNKTFISLFISVFYLIFRFFTYEVAAIYVNLCFVAWFSAFFSAVIKDCVNLLSIFGLHSKESDYDEIIEWTLLFGVCGVVAFGWYCVINQVIMRLNSSIIFICSLNEEINWWWHFLKLFLF